MTLRSYSASRDEGRGSSLHRVPLAKVAWHQQTIGNRTLCASETAFQGSGQVFPKIELRTSETRRFFHAGVCPGRPTDVFARRACLPYSVAEGRTFVHDFARDRPSRRPGPRITRTNPLSCDCAADRWAVTEGQRFFSAHGMNLDIRSALHEIELALSDLMPATDLNSERWCFDWSRRKTALTSAPAPQVVECGFEDS